jgi:hypothetical protein
MTNTTRDRPDFIVVLRPEPHVVDSIKALRGALKTVGLRAIMVDVEHQAGQEDA